MPPGADRRIDRRTVHRGLGFFRAYRRRVALTMVAILVVAVLGLLNPLLLKLIVDEAIPDWDLDALYRYVWLMVAVPIATGPIGVGQTYLKTLIGQRVMQDPRNVLDGHLQRMPLRFFTARPAAARSSPASAATSAAANTWSRRRRRASSATWRPPSPPSSRCG